MCCMPVRKIPKNYRNLTGKAASDKSNSAFFESTLERDFLTLLEFDPQVIIYDVQPVVVSWVDSEGMRRTYTPDVLIKYRKGGCAYSSFDTILCEIKYRSEIVKKWSDLKPKFKAAIKYSGEMGWRFKIFTEQEVRTIYMENARFLLPYMSKGIDDAYAEMLLNKLIERRQCSIEGLLNSVFLDRWAQAELIPTLWYLIGLGRIKTDLNMPLTMSSEIRLKD